MIAHSGLLHVFLGLLRHQQCKLLTGLLVQSPKVEPEPMVDMGQSEYFCLCVGLKSLSQEHYILFVAGPPGSGEVEGDRPLDPENGRLTKEFDRARVTKQTPCPEPHSQMSSS